MSDYYHMASAPRAEAPPDGTLPTLTRGVIMMLK